jgi:hypothetical protein
MSLIEEMIFDIDYLLENIYDDMVKLINILPYDEIQYNKNDKDIFYTYVSFTIKNINKIFLEKEFKEVKILNLFHEHKLNLTNTELSMGIKISYIGKSIKDNLINIRELLLPLYIQMKKNKSI